MMLLLTERYACADPVNIGYEQDVSMAELVSLICEVTGQRPEILFDTSKPEGHFRKCANSTLLHKVTENYQPEIGLREGIQEMVQWYFRNFRGDTQ